jgi:hypothetical protein
VLNDLKASENVTLGIDERFTVLEGNKLSDFILINKVVITKMDEHIPSES